MKNEDIHSKQTMNNLTKLQFVEALIFSQMVSNPVSIYSNDPEAATYKAQEKAKYLIELWNNRDRN